MHTRYEPDGWHPDGRKILSGENVAAIQAKFNEGPIIVRQWFYRAARSPEVYSFSNYEDFEEHLQDHAKPGDAFDVWSFHDVCLYENMLTQGKLPDADGCTPKGGAY